MQDMVEQIPNEQDEAIYAACAPKNLKRVLNLTLEGMRDIRQHGRTVEAVVHGRLSWQRAAGTSA